MLLVLQAVAVACALWSACTLLIVIRNRWKLICGERHGTRPSSASANSSPAQGGYISGGTVLIPGPVSPAYVAAFKQQWAAMQAGIITPNQARAALGIRSIQHFSSATGVSTTYYLDDEPTPLPNAGIVVGELVGWRVWWGDEKFLRSFSADRRWLPEYPMEGEPTDHGPTGVWAFKTRERAEQKYREMFGSIFCHPLDTERKKSKIPVLGSAYLWGDVVEHEDGYRAEFAKVRSIEGEDSARYREIYGVGTGEDCERENSTAPASSITPPAMKPAGS